MKAETFTREHEKFIAKIAPYEMNRKFKRIGSTACKFNPKSGWALFTAAYIDVNSGKVHYVGHSYSEPQEDETNDS